MSFCEMIVLDIWKHCEHVQFLRAKETDVNAVQH